MTVAPFILASASPRRKALLGLIGVTPDKIISSDIDESPRANELPRDLALRLAQEKALSVAARHVDAFVLGSDTVVGCGRRIFPKAEDEQTERDCLKILSGRTHRVFSGVALVYPDATVSARIVETRVKVRRLEDKAIDEYIASGEWDGKAGGYAIQGLAAAWIRLLGGSYSNIVGLPLFEVSGWLQNEGLFPNIA